MMTLIEGIDSKSPLLASHPTHQCSFPGRACLVPWVCDQSRRHSHPIPTLTLGIVHQLAGLSFVPRVSKLDVAEVQQSS